MKFEVVELIMCDGEVCRLIYSHKFLHFKRHGRVSDEDCVRGLKDIGYKLPERVNICGSSLSTVFVEDEHGKPLFNLERSVG